MFLLFILSGKYFFTVPPPVQPRSLSLHPNHAATLQATNFSNSTSGSAAALNSKLRTQSLTTMGVLPGQPPQENLYSLAGQDVTYGQHKPPSTGIPLSDYFEQSGIGKAKKSEGDSRASVTSNGPPSGIPLSEALSMKGYSTLAQCTVGPAVPPRTPLNEALQIKGFSQMSRTEGDSASSTTSIAREAEMEVKRMLRQQSFSDVQVKPGTPLNEALAQKGIGSSSMGNRSSGSSISSRSKSLPDDEPEDYYKVPQNNQPAFFPENEGTPPPHYDSPTSRVPEGHYQSPRRLMDDAPDQVYNVPPPARPLHNPRSLMDDDPPDQVYNVPPPARPAPVPRTSPSRKKRSTLLSKDNGNEAANGKVNGTTAPPVINRASKPRPPPISRDNKPGRSESFKNDIPQPTKDSVHYVSLWKLKEEQMGKPVPRPRTATRKSDYSEVDLEGTLALDKKRFVVKDGDTPPVPLRTRDSLMDVYSSDDDDDDDSAGSEISYTRMRVS